MKDILTFIKEQLLNEETEVVLKLKSLKITYVTVPENIVIAVPSNYAETDVQMYIDDICLKEFPGINEQSKKLLGDNIKHINDAYFTYSGYEASDNYQTSINIDWDEKYDDNNSSDEFSYFKLKNLKYIMEFSEFNIKDIADESNEGIESTIKQIFTTLESNSSNNYPIVIKYKSCEFEKE